MVMTHTFIHDFLLDFFSGMMGGCAVVMVGQPMDTVKVKMQTFGHLYSGVVQCARTTLASEGIRRGFYAGTSPALVAYVSENSVLFTALGQTQKFVARVRGKQKIEDLGLIEKGAAGSCASLFSELIKCRLQAAKQMGQEDAGVISTVRNILVSDGLIGLYRGLIPTWCREIPGYFCFFLGYESSKAALCRLRRVTEDRLTPPETMVCGGVAGLCFWSAIFPLDVIKSRIQVRGVRGNVLTVGRSIVAQEGARALYRGITPALIRTFPANAALFLAYESTKKLLTETFFQL